MGMRVCEPKTEMHTDSGPRRMIQQRLGLGQQDVKIYIFETLISVLLAIQDRPAPCALYFPPKKRVSTAALEQKR